MMTLNIDPDSLRKRGVDARFYARNASNAEIRRQFLELAQHYVDLADTLDSLPEARINRQVA
jgi:hypothetical protein